MDPVPDGPRRIGERHQVTLPHEALSSVGIGSGDNVWIAVNPDRPGTLLVIPESLMADIFRKGWTAVG